MSANEIQALCELYIGRKFDDNDSQALREFLRDLQVQKPKKVAAEKPEQHQDTKKFVPVSERKQHLVREYAPGDRPAPVALTDLGATGGAKERMAAYNNQVASAGSTGSLSANRVAEDLPAQVPKVADRKAQWAAAETGLSPRADDAVKERLAEVTGAPGVKDRLGAWNNATQGSSADKIHLVEERTADVKGAAPVKERLGNWNKIEEHPSVTSNTAARVEEVKGAPGVKDRLGNWNQVTSDHHVESKTAERLAELAGASAVKSRAEGWNNHTEGVITSAGLSEERTAELKKASSVRDRMNSYSQAASEVKVQKTEIYIPQDVSELPTKESQGQ